MQKYLLLLLTLCFPTFLSAQTQLDLGSQVKGQVAPANSINLRNTVPSSGVHRGSQAMTGYTEQFSSDGHCIPGTTNVMGFDYSAALSCYNPGFFHTTTTGTNFNLYRNLAYGTTNAIPPSPNHFAVTMTDVFDGQSNDAIIGMSNCGINTWNCGGAYEMDAYIGPAGFGLYWAGTSTTLWATGGNGSGISGSTDSGFGNGWAAPVSGAEYDVSLFSPGDSTAMLSIMPQGGKLCAGGSCATAFRVPISYPAGSTHQFVLRGSSGNDFIANVGEADGYNLQGGYPIYDFSADENTHTGRMMRWALHADGSEWNYQGSCADCANVWAWIPPNYSPNTANPWIIHIHGNEDAIVSLYGDYDNPGSPGQIADTLFQNGIVIISLDFHSTVSGCGDCVYGNTQNVLDIATAIAKVRSALSLAAQPYAMADSAGGVTLMNAITHGAVTPKAILCYSCNLSLLSDAQGNNYVNQQANATQMPEIESAYGFSNPSLYSISTAGYDPLVVVQLPNLAQATTTGTYALLPNAAQLLASIPIYLAADPTDQTVNTAVNSVAYAAALNAINPGIATYYSSIGGHVGAQEMIGAQALSWINTHQ